MTEIGGAVAFVTGGASGIGLGIAQALADAGARVALADIDADQLELARGTVANDALTLRLDVSDRGAWAAAKAEVEARLGPVDILVNNAGIAGDGHRIATMDPDAFDRVIRINLTGTYNGIATFIGGMIERGRGHVLNTASLAGLVHPPTLAAYAAAKAGVIALSDSLRQEVAEAGIGVTVLCPGQVRTRIDETTRAAGSDRPPRSALPSKAARLIEPREVGDMAVDAIRQNHPYLITHWEYRQPFEERMATILEAFGRRTARGE